MHVAVTWRGSATRCVLQLNSQSNYKLDCSYLIELCIGLISLFDRHSFRRLWRLMEGERKRKRRRLVRADIARATVEDTSSSSAVPKTEGDHNHNAINRYLNEKDTPVDKTKSVANIVCYGMVGVTASSSFPASYTHYQCLAARKPANYIHRDSYYHRQSNPRLRII